MGGKKFTTRSNSWGGKQGSGGWQSQSDNAKLEARIKQLVEQNKALRDAKNKDGILPNGKHKHADDSTPHPLAKCSPPMDGDWKCLACNFTSNRVWRTYCFRCSAVMGREAIPILDATTTAQLQQSIATEDAARVMAEQIAAATMPSTAVASHSAACGQQGFGHQPNGQPLAAQTTPPPASSLRELKARQERLKVQRGMVGDGPADERLRTHLDFEIKEVQRQIDQALPIDVSFHGALAAE